MATSPRHAQAQRRAVWPPQPGFFAFQLVKRGWRVPARILFADGLWRAELDGKLCDAHPDPIYADYVARIWQAGIKIDEQTYHWLLAMKAHARAHEPDHPAANPREAIDHGLLRPLT